MPSRRRFVAALSACFAARIGDPTASAGELPAPPTAAQAFTEDQLLKWIAALGPVTRETLQARLPATFTARQETRYRISWQADLSQVRQWFAEVEFLQAGDEAICRMRMQPGNAVSQAKARSILGGFEPLPPPSPPPLSPTQGRIDNPVFSRIYLRTRLPDERTLHLVFEPLERGGSLFEVTLSQSPAR